MTHSRLVSRRRLLTLVQRLKRVKPKRFDMEIWAKSQHPCRTAGCAVGYATTIPAFRRAGLKLRQRIHGPRDLAFRPTYHGKRGTDAVQAFFHLGATDVEDLFMPESYSPPTLSNVIQRIEAFAEKIP